LKGNDSLSPFERIFTLLNGLNFRDFLDIAIYLLIQDHDVKHVVDSELQWYIDTAVFDQYVSGRSLNAWAELSSIEVAQIPQVRHPPQSGWLDELGRLKGGRPSV
jgi:hypothetical protein